MIYFLAAVRNLPSLFWSFKYAMFRT